MEAGRELDALVAEKVMGWIRMLEDGVYYNLPAYSTDIAAAWEVVEKLQEGGMSVGLIDDDSGHWALASTGWQDAPCGEEPVDMASTFIVEKDEWADTAPLAICLAALKAMPQGEGDMKRLLRWLFGITACKLIELKEGDCLLVTTPPERRMSQSDLKAAKEAFEHHIGKRVLIAEPGFELTVIRPPGD